MYTTLALSDEKFKKKQRITMRLEPDSAGDSKVFLNESRHCRVMIPIGRIEPEELDIIQAFESRLDLYTARFWFLTTSLTLVPRCAYGKLHVVLYLRREARQLH